MDTETLTNSVVIAKLLVEEIGETPSYEEAVNTADNLNITVDQVFGFIRLYKQVSREIIL